MYIFTCVNVWKTHFLTKCSWSSRRFSVSLLWHSAPLCGRLLSSCCHGAPSFACCYRVFKSEMPSTTSFSNLRRRWRGRSRGWFPHSLAPPPSTPEARAVIYRREDLSLGGNVVLQQSPPIWLFPGIVTWPPSPPEWRVAFQSCGGGEWPMTFLFRRDTRSLKGFLVTLALEGKIQTQTNTAKGESADRSVIPRKRLP